MHTPSLIEKLGFTTSDLLATGGRKLGLDGGKSRYLLGERLYKAISAEAQARQSAVEPVFLALQAEVLSSYEHQCGPVASKLGFKISDLMEAGERFATLDGDRTAYPLSERLFGAIQAQARETKSTFTPVFVQLRNELIGYVAPEAVQAEPDECQDEEFA